MINSTFTIGITGNIGTGKSVLRRMLANAGALGMDADVLAHRMYYPGGPAHRPIIEAFGPEILTDHKLISTHKLGKIVFNDPRRLQLLESIVHPYVIEVILKRIRAARRPFAALEAIKLLEANLEGYCDRIWVSHAPVEHQVQRLMISRRMNEGEARLRIEAQPSQSVKLARADVIINTEGTFKDTWRRTQKALNDTIQILKNRSVLHINSSNGWKAKSVNTFPNSQLEASWSELGGADSADLYEVLGMKRIFPILSEEQIKAFVVWEDWNFSATLEKVYPAEFLKEMPGLVFDLFTELASIDQAEILLLPEALIRESGLEPEAYGFDHQHIDQITYPAWRAAAQKATPGDPPMIGSKILTQPFEMQAPSSSS